MRIVKSSSCRNFIFSNGWQLFRNKICTNTKCKMKERRDEIIQQQKKKENITMKRTKFPLKTKNGHPFFSSSIHSTFSILWPFVSIFFSLSLNSLARPSACSHSSSSSLSTLSLASTYIFLSLVSVSRFCVASFTLALTSFVIALIFIF